MIIVTINAIWPKLEVGRTVIVALFQMPTTMLGRRCRQVKAVHLVASVTPATKVDSAHINLLMVHLVPAVCNVNPICAHNMTTNKMSAIHALVIIPRLQIHMDWKELHIVTLIINIVLQTFLVRIKKQLDHLVMEIISHVTRVSVIKIQ
jgi:hypothetical protein